MDLTFNTTFLVIIFTLITTFLYKLFLRSSKNAIPEPGFAWPIIGHLHLFLSSKDRLVHRVLGDLADKYGPIFLMRQGARKVLVVSNPQLAKECLVTKYKHIAGRPGTIALDHITYNYANFTFGPANPYWRDVKKVVTLELLSNRRIQALRDDRESAARTLIKDMYRSWTTRDQNGVNNNYVTLDMKKWFDKLLISLMLKIIFGIRYEEAGSWVAETFERSFSLIASFVVGDYLPWLRWLDIGGYEKAIKENAKQLDSVVEEWLKQHKSRRSCKDHKEDEDFMDAMLTRCETEKHILDHGFDADTVVKATCLAMLAAGTNTTSTAMTWGLALILNHENALQKLQAELDTHVGRERPVTESDLNNLVYLQAVVEETFRLHPPGPLLLPHQSIEDCEIGGYDIPKGTEITINVSRIQRDPALWDRPNEFRPERFLEEKKEIDLKGNSFELIPFGAGRRICSGMSLGLQGVHLCLASVIQGFDIKRVSDDELIDMTEAMSLAVGKATPLEVLLTPRLDSHLYTA